MVTTLQDVYNSIHDTGILFNVREEPIFSKSGSQVLGKKAIINEATNDVVGCVSNSYKTLSNKTVVDAMLKSLDRSDLSLDGASVNITTSHHGARAMIDLILPDHSVKVPGDSSESVLQISTLNSYDGRWKFMSRGGAVRLACANGQILGNFMGSYTSYHTSRLDIDAGAKQMVGMFETFLKAPDWWAKMMETPASDGDVVRAVALYLGVAYPFKKGEEEEKFRSRKTFIEVEKKFVTYSKEFGANAYALFNAFTDYISHSEYKKATHGAALLQAQDKFQKVLIRHDVFTP